MTSHARRGRSVFRRRGTFGFYERELVSWANHRGRSTGVHILREAAALYQITDAVEKENRSLVSAQMLLSRGRGSTVRVSRWCALPSSCSRTDRSRSRLGQRSRAPWPSFG